MKTIEQLKADVEAARHAMTEARKPYEATLRQAQDALTAAEHAARPWRIGDIVQKTRTSFIGDKHKVRHGELHKITSHYPGYPDWAKGVTKKKNGDWGQREHTLYGDFDIIEKGPGHDESPV